MNNRIVVILWRDEPLISLEISGHHLITDIVKWYAGEYAFDTVDLRVILVDKIENHPFIKPKSKQIERSVCK